MAQAVEDTLLVRMEASLRKFERQMEDGRKAAVRAAQGAERAWDQGGKGIVANSNRAVTGLNKMTASAGAGRFVLQNTANQIGDIAVQLQGGAGAARAFGQQLPQLFGGFGVLGGSLGLVAPLLGTVAAIGIPVAAAFLMMGDGSQTLDNRIKELGETIKLLESGIGFLQLDMEELTQKYGEAADRVRQFALAQAEIRADQAAERLREQVGLLDDLITGYMSSSDAGLRYENTLERIQEDLKVGREDAQNLKSLFENLFTAEGFPEQQAALQAILTVLEEAQVPLSEIPNDLKLALQEMINLSNETDRAAKLMADLRAEAAGVTIGVPLYDQGLSGSELLPPDEMPTKPKPGRGGGGAARTAINEGLQEVERLYDSTRTNAEKYAIELERINELHRLFPEIVTEDVRDRAVQALDDSTRQLNDTTKTLESSLATMFTSIVTGSASAKDALAGLLGTLAQVFANRAFTSLFGSINIPGFATGTSYAPGGMALVGERGPELVNLPRGSQVFSADRSSRMTSGGGAVHVTVSVDQSGNIVPVIERVSGQVSARTVQNGLKEYDRKVAPQTARRTQSDPRRIG
ncbi:hypothetical protein GI582_18145 [Sulfitobacter sp. BDSS02]|nr:hypothetical protein [Sulfitobacter sp. BDSS02]